ncbi:hypothetical protein LSAT2_032048 [Lamellibrachia satsuma]|nr:hypothetical protein LSAT2_032048 [Lamellibrachia satsuma]
MRNTQNAYFRRLSARDYSGQYVVERMEVSNRTSTVCLLLLLLMTGADAHLLHGLLYQYCSGKPFNRITQICCDGVVYTPEDTLGRNFCCRGKPYNADTHVCCVRWRIMTRDWVKDHERKCYSRRVPLADHD